MKKWEYKIEKSVESKTLAFNPLGDEGWELAAIWEDVFIFKREKEWSCP